MDDVVREVGRAIFCLVDRDWERCDGMWFRGCSLERVDGSGGVDERDALGEAMGQEEASAGDCGDFRGGKGEVELALCMGHPGLDGQLWLLKHLLAVAYWRGDI